MSAPSDSDPTAPKASAGETLVLVLCILALFVFTFGLMVAIIYLHMRVLLYIATAAHLPRDEYDSAWEWQLARLRITIKRSARFSEAYERMMALITSFLAGPAWLGVIFFFQLHPGKHGDSWSILFVLPMVVGLASLAAVPVLWAGVILLLPRPQGSGIAGTLARYVDRWE